MTAKNAVCGSRIAERKIRNRQSEIRNLVASFSVRLLALIFCFVLTAVAPAQTLEEKCGLRNADSGTEADKPTQRVEAQTPDSGGQLSILKPNLLDAERQTSTDQHQPIEPKLPAVRCTLAPTKDAVRWQLTPVAPGTPVAEKDESMQRVESQTDNPQFEIRNSKLRDRKSTRLNSSHQIISYAVFC